MQLPNNINNKTNNNNNNNNKKTFYHLTELPSNRNILAIISSMTLLG